MSFPTSRRMFLRNSALAGAGLIVLTHGRTLRSYEANEKVNVVRQVNDPRELVR